MSEPARAIGGTSWASIDDLRVDVIPGHRDPRGVLFPAELPALAGFAPVRLFFIADVPAGETRGGHGHKLCAQYLICCAGRIKVGVFDGVAERTLVIGQGEGMLLPPGIYGAQTFAAPGSILLVLCDRPYEPDDYLHTRDALVAYRAAVASPPAPFRS